MNQQLITIEMKKANSMLPHQVMQREDQTMIYITKEDQSWRLYPTHFSSWKRFLRVNAWVRHFVDNCRVDKRESGELKPSEIEDTEVQAIRSAQREACPVE